MAVFIVETKRSISNPCVLFKYTFEQQRTESYLACLDVWNVCVDYVLGLISSRIPEADVIVLKYRGLFILKICVDYRTPTIITRSLFETALNYKLPILGPTFLVYVLT